MKKTTDKHHQEVANHHGYDPQKAQDEAENQIININKALTAASNGFVRITIPLTITSKI